MSARTVIKLCLQERQKLAHFGHLGHFNGSGEVQPVHPARIANEDILDEPEEDAQILGVVYTKHTGELVDTSRWHNPPAWREQNRSPIIYKKGCVRTSIDMFLQLGHRTAGLVEDLNKMEIAFGRYVSKGTMPDYRVVESKIRQIDKGTRLWQGVLVALLQVRAGFHASLGSQKMRRQRKLHNRRPGPWTVFQNIQSPLLQDKNGLQHIPNQLRSWLQQGILSALSHSNDVVPLYKVRNHKHYRAKRDSKYMDLPIKLAQEAERVTAELALAKSQHETWLIRVEFYALISRQLLQDLKQFKQLNATNENLQERLSLFDRYLKKAVLQHHIFDAFDQHKPPKSVKDIQGKIWKLLHCLKPREKESGHFKTIYKKHLNKLGRPSIMYTSTVPPQSTPRHGRKKNKPVLK